MTLENYSILHIALTSSLTCYVLADAVNSAVTVKLNKTKQRNAVINFKSKVTIVIIQVVKNIS